MSNGQPWSLFLEDDLRLLIELGALGLIGRQLGCLNELLEILIAPVCAVCAADGLTAQKKLSGSAMPPVQPSMTAPSRSFSSERLRYSPQS